MQTKKSPIENSCPNGKKTALPEYKDRTFRRQEHLKRRVTIARVFKKGKVAGCSGYKLFFLANELSCNRIVITFARKYGNAVKRNRARRLGQEAYRLMKDELKTGYDLVLLEYPPADLSEAGRGTLEETSRQLKTLFKKAGIIRTADWRMRE